jgi:hypothetical protein
MFFTTIHNKIYLNFYYFSIKNFTINCKFTLTVDIFKHKFVQGFHTNLPRLFISNHNKLPYNFHHFLLKFTWLNAGFILTIDIINM